ncbi:MAG TPA: hypothetical protein VHW23_42950 [Kofleriaceae bacterium]|nr:hypothetical protein [Kofleriaceae bacterium]
MVRNHTGRQLYFTTAFNGIMRVIKLDELDFSQPVAPGRFPSVPLMPAPERFAWVEDATRQFHIETPA